MLTSHDEQLANHTTTFTDILLNELTSGDTNKATDKEKGNKDEESDVSKKHKEVHQPLTSALSKLTNQCDGRRLVQEVSYRYPAKEV